MDLACRVELLQVFGGHGPKLGLGEHVPPRIVGCVKRVHASNVADSDRFSYQRTVDHYVQKHLLDRYSGKLYWFGLESAAGV